MLPMKLARSSMLVLAALGLASCAGSTKSVDVTPRISLPPMPAHVRAAAAAPLTTIPATSADAAADARLLLKIRQSEARYARATRDAVRIYDARRRDIARITAKKKGK